MTIPRLVLILSVGIAIVDLKFNDGRIVSAVWDQLLQTIDWLNDEFSSIVNNIVVYR